METYILLNNEYEIRTEEHQGVKHIVVPVVMMVEGVHSGSAGPLLHLAEDLGKFTGAWNGIPVVIQHPQIDGMNVSANLPDVIDKEMVGKVYNTVMDGDKLKAEVWLNETRLKQVSPRAFNAIKNKEELDVSIGVFTEEEEHKGEYKGITYEQIARNHRPDHLALLPGAVGACSWDDGCGIRLNSDNNKQKEEKQMSTEKSLCCLAKVEKLINNKATHFTKDDTEWLLAQEETTLDKLMPIDAKPVVNEKIVEVKVEAKPKTFEELLAEAKPEIQEQVNYGLQVHKEQKTVVVNSIIANTKEGVWNKEELEQMDMNMLKKISDSLPETVNYSGLNTKAPEVNKNAEVLLPTGVEIKE